MLKLQENTIKESKYGNTDSFGDNRQGGEGRGWRVHRREGKGVIGGGKWRDEEKTKEKRKRGWRNGEEA